MLNAFDTEVRNIVAGEIPCTGACHGSAAIVTDQITKDTLVLHPCSDARAAAAGVNGPEVGLSCTACHLHALLDLFGWLHK